MEYLAAFVTVGLLTLMVVAVMDTFKGRPS
jgi:hypothetical protein